MSKVRILIPVGLNEIRAMMPPQHHIESVKLVDDKGDGAVEVVYDDPARKSPFTFPADQPLDEFKALGTERSRLAAIQKDKAEQELKAIQEAAEAQLKAEEEAAAKPPQPGEDAPAVVAEAQAAQEVQKPRKKRG